MNVDIYSRTIRTTILTVLLVSLVVGAGHIPTVSAAQKEICITFDELPASQTFEEVDPETILRPILEALDKYEVKAAGFVVGQNINGSFDLLGEWLNQSNRIGSMTYSYTDLHDVGIESFIRDLIHGEKELETMLAGFGQEPRFFRYPFLHYGTTVEAQRAVSLYLEENNVQAAHATVVVEDYLYNLPLQKYGDEIDSAAYDKMLNEYVNHVLDQIEAAERKSKELLGRNCRQILQLRANRLNALFIDEMLGAIKSMGYEFVSLDAALRDPVYSKPHAYFGPHGAGYLYMLEHSNPDLLPAGE